MSDFWFYLVYGLIGLASGIWFARDTAKTRDFYGNYESDGMVALSFFASGLLWPVVVLIFLVQGLGRLLRLGIERD